MIKHHPTFTTLLLFLLLGCIAPSAIAQSITLSGKVLDGYTKRPVSSVSVIVAEQNVSYMTDAQGRFSLACDKHDTLYLFFPGYKTIRFSVADSTSESSSYFVNLTFNPLSTSLSQPVIVRPKKDLDDIEKERKNLGSMPRELMKPEIEFMSPISAIYDLVSARAKERNKLRKQYLDDERRRVYRELFDYFKEKQLFDLPEEYYDQFIDYMNLPVDFLRESSDYTITKTLLDNYKKFGIDRGFVK